MTTHIEKMIRSMENDLKNITTRPSRILEREMEKAIKIADINTRGPAQRFAEAVQIISDIASINNVKFSSDAVGNLIKHQREFTRRFNSIPGNNALLKWSANFGSIRSSVSALEAIQNMPLEDYYEEELTAINEEEVIETETDEFLLHKLFLYFQQKIAELPKGKITALGFMQLAVNFLVLYVSIQQGNEAEKDRKVSIRIQKSTDKKIEVLTNKLSPILQDVAKTEHEEIILSIKKKCPIRSKPTSESDTLTSAFIGQEIEVVDSLSRWYQIKYFEPSDTTIRTGFIYKGHVK